MHEWALAEAVASTAIDVAKKEGFEEITRICIKIGEMQQIDLETFEFILKEVIKTQNPSLKKTEIELTTEPCILRCRVCGNKWTFSDMVKGLNEEEAEAVHFIPEIVKTYSRCTECGSPDFEIVEGRGVRIDSIEGVR